MAIANAAIFGRNWAADGTITASSQLGDHVAINMLNSLPGRMWRGQGTPNADGKFEFLIEGDLGKYLLVEAFAMGGHNFTASTTITMELFYNSNKVFDREFRAIKPIYGLGEGPNLWNIGGYPKKSDDVNFTHHILENAVSATNYKLKIISELEFIEIHHLFIGPKFQPRINVLRDPVINWVDQTKHIPTEGGGLLIEPVDPYRVLDVEWALLADKELNQWLDLIRGTGKRGAVLIVLYPSEKSRLALNTAFLAFMNWSPAKHRSETQDSFWHIKVSFREYIK